MQWAIVCPNPYPTDYYSFIGVYDDEKEAIIFASIFNEKVEYHGWHMVIELKEGKE